VISHRPNLSNYVFTKVMSLEHTLLKRGLFANGLWLYSRGPENKLLADAVGFRSVLDVPGDS
jgi:hypothetical protein